MCPCRLADGVGDGNGYHSKSLRPWISGEHCVMADQDANGNDDKDSLGLSGQLFNECKVSAGEWSQ